MNENNNNYDVGWKIDWMNAKETHLNHYNFVLNNLLNPIIEKNHRL